MKKLPRQDVYSGTPDDETCGCNNCKYMKMVTLENICACLENNEIVLERARRRGAAQGRAFDPEHDKYQITILYEETLFTDRRGVRLFDRCGRRGTWLLPYLQKMNIKEMKARGCKLSAERFTASTNPHSRTPS